jgi:hypothetical protein
MRERLARAMCRNDGMIWEDQANAMTSGSGGNDQEVYLSAADAVLAEIAAAGMVLVPREPTEAMVEAVEKGRIEFMQDPLADNDGDMVESDRYIARAMLSAAPAGGE